MKLQESGELGIVMANSGGASEMIRTEFLTDISIRVARFPKDLVEMYIADWRVRIAKGSVVTWPSLINGKVLAN
ncbi:MAG: hypothetical protein ACR2HJ_08935 [Fimbriimonadales bacterium]